MVTVEPHLAFYIRLINTFMTSFFLSKYICVKYIRVQDNVSTKLMTLQNLECK